MDQQTVGNFLRELRLKKELTQEQLAEKFNTSNRSVSRWENGRSLPDISVLVELADFYDVDVRELSFVVGEGDLQQPRVRHVVDRAARLLVAAGPSADEGSTVAGRGPRAPPPARCA